MKNQHGRNLSLHIDTLGGDLRSAITTTAELGFAGVAVGIGHPQFSSPDFGTTARRHWMKILQSHHLTLTAIRAGVGVLGCADWRHAEILIQQAHRAIDLARECCAGEVLIYIGEPPPNPPIPPAAGTMLDGNLHGESKGLKAAGESTADALLDELLAAGDRASVRLVISSGHASWLKAKLKPHYSRMVGAALDSYRVLAAGQAPPVAAQELAGMINSWVCADAVRNGSMTQSVLLGAGAGDMVAVARTLEEQYFSGPIVVDIRGLADPVAASRHAVQSLAELLSADLPTPMRRG